MNRGGYDHYKLPRLVRESVFFLVVRRGCARVMFDKRLAQQSSQDLALVVGDCHEPPWMKLSMIRHARGNCQDARHLLRARSRAD